MFETTLRFFHWWWRGNLSCVPQCIRSWMSGHNEKLLITIDGEDYRCWHVSDRGSRHLGRSNGQQIRRQVIRYCRHFRRRPVPVILGVDAGMVLVREFDVPRRALRFIQRIATSELDRLTPWREDQAWFDTLPEDVSVKGRNDTSTTRARLAAIRKNAVQPLVEKLDGHGVQPDGMDAIEADGNGIVTAGFNLLPVDKRRPRRPWRSMTNMLLGVLVLAVIVVGARQEISSLENQRDVLAERVMNITRQARSVTLLQDRLDNALAAATFLITRKNRQPPVTDLLQQLTDGIDDDTWLYRLDIEERVVRLHGESRRASRLVPSLEQASNLNNVRFISPVVRDPRSGGDRFSLELNFEEVGDAQSVAASDHR